jgi:hypothetical protein
VFAPIPKAKVSTATTVNPGRGAGCAGRSGRPAEVFRRRIRQSFTARLLEHAGNRSTSHLRRP